MALLNKLLLGCCSLQHVGLLQGLARVGPKTPGRLHLTLGLTVFVRFDPIRCMGTMHLTGWGVYFIARVSPKALGRRHLTPGPTVFVIRFDPIRCMGTIPLTGWGVHFMARVSPKTLQRLSAET